MSTCAVEILVSVTEVHTDVRRLSREYERIKYVRSRTCAPRYTAKRYTVA